MNSNFFSRKTPFFGTRAVLILCVVFFLAPFALRGARLAVDRMENNISDWLPKDFPETRDLEWFAKYFMGERFVLLTWPECTEDRNEFRLLLQKLFNEVETDDPVAFGYDPNEDANSANNKAAKERLRARQKGDVLGLFVEYRYDEATSRITTEFYDNHAGLGEKWLRGIGDRWYYITPRGDLYYFGKADSLWGGLGRAFQRQVKGSFKADGKLIASYGQPSTATHANIFHADPRKLAARFFNSITTGPDALNEMSAKDGPLWPRSTDIDDDDRRRIARKMALDRLTGTLFGPATQPGFTWTTEAFYEVLSEKTRSQLPNDWETSFTTYIEKVVTKQFSGDHNALASSPPIKQSQIWDELFVIWRMDPPPRQTCIIVTLSKAGKKDPRRVMGRAIMGKPLGTMLALAYQSGLEPGDLKLGGPPVDNVAIDEEGSITLFRLIAWSAVIGFILSYLCFRSVVTTLMVFFVGGLSAVASLGMVWWSGASVDAVLMSMPALVYVLGLSGAIHIINYYREAVVTDGKENAPWKALVHGWGPCTLAAFTTALGLISLYASTLLPIKKFGLFSALGVMATLILMFTYLPSALTTWAPKPPRRKEGDAPERSTLGSAVQRMWLVAGRWVIGHHVQVLVVTAIVMIICALGLPKINPSVQLLKLFDKDSKIISDYTWLEANFGKLVPMELVVRVKPEAMLMPDTEVTPAEGRMRYNFLERIELALRVQTVVENYFGEAGRDIVGPGLCAATFGPPLPSPTSRQRSVMNLRLEKASDRFYEEDYVATDKLTGSELLRVSLRVGALNDVDYGEFVNDLRQVVEPVMSAHRYRDEILRTIEAQTGGKGVRGTSILLLGTSPQARAVAAKITASGEEAPNQTDTLAVPGSGQVTESGAGRMISPEDQTEIFAQALNELLLIESFRPGRRHDTKMDWYDPVAVPTGGDWEKLVGNYNMVILVQNHPDFPLDLIRSQAKSFLDATDHRYDVATSKTSVQRDDPVSVVYTGVIPVVYKAQRSLLNSLITSIGLAFVMIACVMMILLRDWWSPLGRSNGINVSAGMISMVPNVFPVVLVFGLMGHMSSLVDIGTMMTASVAMGVAVDDTIHFLTWFRIGIRDGLSRKEAILEAYRRVATAMTQTTLIGGLGLSVFAASTFTPTQQFGVMMVFLLTAALVGDLIILPAILASPLGALFCPKVDAASGNASPSKDASGETAVAPGQQVASSGQSAPAFTAHSRKRGIGSRTHLRPDPGHGGQTQ
jgi:predicted RND superfamily exporter protein